MKIVTNIARAAAAAAGAIPRAQSAAGPELGGLGLLASAVVIVDADGRIAYANAAAENMLESSLKALSRQRLCDLFTHPVELEHVIAQARAHKFSDLRQELTLERINREPLHVHTIASALDDPADAVLLELRETVQQMKLDREERLLDQSQVNKELIRNLAHEIKNPLGGIRGAAQLLEMELPPLHLQQLREYTQVIIKEADRLQTLVDRLLAPHRRPHIVGDVNIHEVVERVRSLITAEFPSGLEILRDYDASLPEFRGDKEQLIQTVLNIAHNAAQALADRIQKEIGTFGYRVFTDSAPVMELPLAEKSGLGWRGKHTLLINRSAGSMFFMGEILIDLPLPVDAPTEPRCGQCTACIDVCPTQAIVAPGRLDARRCISYLTIELKGAIPEEFRPLIGNRVYGCDDCQTACPWNKFAQRATLPDFDERHGLGDASMVELFAWSEDDFNRRMEGSPIRRIGHERWLRNIAVGLGNAAATAQGDPVLVAALRSRLDHPSELVREHVLWALARHVAD